MGSYYASAYLESGDLPLSGGIDGENPAMWEDGPTASRIRLMCSYGGKIQPRAPDNQLTYVGGETRVLVFDRSTRYAAVVAKLASIANAAAVEVCLKYQLPGEELDALISVANDEDLAHMMFEYDRLPRSASKPVPRLRVFVFSVSLCCPVTDPEEWKSDCERFVEVLNTVPPILPVASAPAATATPDYLFGFDVEALPPQPQPQPLETVAVEVPSQVETIATETTVREEQVSIRVDVSEIQRHIQELQQFQIAENLDGSANSLAAVPCMPELLPLVIPAVQPSVALPPAPDPGYWADPRTYASTAGKDNSIPFIPATGGFPLGANGPGYYTAVPWVYHDARPLFAMPQPPPQNPAAFPVGDTAAAAAVAPYAPAHMAIPVYYTAVGVPTYQPVAPLTLPPQVNNNLVKPPQLA